MRMTIRAFSGLAAVLLSTQLPGQAVKWIEVPLADNTYREQVREMSRDVISIPMQPFGKLEYKLGMEADDAIVYSWTADMDNPEMLYAEFHGHTEVEPGEAGTVMFYRKAEGGAERGALTAPFTGIHGWYLENRSSVPIVVELEVAGYYELIDQ